ncbi:MAG: hypothetical protein RL607_80 [Bacteroidota bacterium]|jgi:hypothetical protein
MTDNTTFIAFLKHLPLIVYYEGVIAILVTLFILKSKKQHYVLLLILLLYVFNEYSTYYLRFIDVEKYDILDHYIMISSMVITKILWYIQLMKLNIFKRKMPWIIASFIIIVFLLIYKLGLQNVSYVIFPIGSIIYLFIYFFTCFKKLKSEDFEFFFSNNFILISSPLFLFFGISMIFSFVSYKVQETELFGKTLMTIVGNYINMITYSLFLLFAYKEYRTAKQIEQL